MNAFWPEIIKILAFLGDIGLFYLSLLLTLLIRYQTSFDQYVWQLHWPAFTGLLIFWLIIFYSFSLYDLTLIKRAMEFYNNYFKASVLNVAIGIIYFYVISHAAEISPKTNLAIMIVIFSAFYFLWHRSLAKLSGNQKFLQNLLFIGYHPLIEDLLPKSTSATRFGFNFKGIADDQNQLNPYLKLKKYNFLELPEIIKKEKIDLLVFTEPINQETTQLLFKIIPLRISFMSLNNFYEAMTNKIPLSNISQAWFLENFSEGRKRVFELLKRLIDFVFSILLAIISLPLIPLIALLIAVDSRGNVFFAQIRVGKDGKKFRAIKFRSMYKNAESNGAMWAKENDPRITKIGNFLRKTRLDEIPQLWNILRGEMSFVGPRPERPEFIEKLEIDVPFYKERLLVKPGLTGWAQINYPYADSIESSLKKLQYDLYYIKKRSIFLDLSIILKTINIIFKHGGR